MEKNIKTLLPFLEDAVVTGNTEAVISGITLDSRTIRPGTLFIAQKGEVFDGHIFIETVIENGVSVVICEVLPEHIVEQVTYIQVADSHHAAGIVAAWFYDFPAEKLTIIGVTGTNGKTTVATLTWQALRTLGHKVGLISTVSCWINDQEFPSSHTTPDALSLHKYFQAMVDAGCDHVAMEVSSHAIAQKRVAGLKFKVAIFTNLTQDHLDFHKTMENYRDTKKKLFSGLSATAMAITNADDDNGLYMVDDCPAKKISYGIAHNADYQAQNISLSTAGSTFTIEGTTVTTQLIGDFNLSNTLAVYATLRALGYEKGAIVTAFATLVPPPGRFEIIPGPDNRIGVVDYAHTPDGLEKLLSTLEKLKTENSSLIVVFGCGGNRDTTKRPIMGRIATEHSDFCIVTSDNPRNENPDSICQDIVQGIAEGATYEVIVDRKAAILKAVAIARPGDTIAIAGKGHEQYQNIGDQKNHFSDQEILREAFQK
jgi:UDP-N-acetylmuramoyl-L-alanyl-D-glutamate--2,6-diaminopimelate ligase